MQRFEQALRNALPELDLETLHTRIRLLIGTTVIHLITRDSERGTPAGALIEFLPAGLAAPATEPRPAVEPQTAAGLLQRATERRPQPS